MRLLSMSVMRPERFLPRASLERGRLCNFFAIGSFSIASANALLKPRQSLVMFAEIEPSRQAVARFRGLEAEAGHNAWSMRRPDCDALRRMVG